MNHCAGEVKGNRDGFLVASTSDGNTHLSQRTREMGHPADDRQYRGGLKARTRQDRDGVFTHGSGAGERLKGPDSEPLGKQEQENSTVPVITPLDNVPVTLQVPCAFDDVEVRENVDEVIVPE